MLRDLMKALISALIALVRAAFVIMEVAPEETST
jgi:hypothetical protein